MAEFQEVMRQEARMRKHEDNMDFLYRLQDIWVTNPARFERAVMRWAKLHPEKTMKDVLLEKFPKAMLRTDGMPCTCVAYLGLGTCIDNCAKHWSSPAPEE